MHGIEKTIASSDSGRLEGLLRGISCAADQPGTLGEEEHGQQQHIIHAGHALAEGQCNCWGGQFTARSAVLLIRVMSCLTCVMSVKVHAVHVQDGRCTLRRAEHHARSFSYVHPSSLKSSGIRVSFANSVQTFMPVECLSMAHILFSRGDCRSDV
jgi:hypothetical protein